MTLTGGSKSLKYNSKPYLEVFSKDNNIRESTWKDFQKIENNPTLVL
jgi:hypothetical protein